MLRLALRHPQGQGLHDDRRPGVEPGHEEGAREDRRRRRRPEAAHSRRRRGRLQAHQVPADQGRGGQVHLLHEHPQADSQHQGARHRHAERRPRRHGLRQRRR